MSTDPKGWDNWCILTFRDKECTGVRVAVFDGLPAVFDGKERSKVKVQSYTPRNVIIQEVRPDNTTRYYLGGPDTAQDWGFADGSMIYGLYPMMEL